MADGGRSRLPTLAAQERLHSPWVLDIPLTPDRDGRKSHKRDPSHVTDVTDATFTADDRICYLRPEIDMSYKAALTGGSRGSEQANPRWVPQRPLFGYNRTSLHAQSLALTSGGKGTEDLGPG